MLNEFSNPETADYDLKVAVESETQDINYANNYSQTLLELAKIIEGNYAEYGISLEEQENPTQDTILKILSKLPEELLNKVSRETILLLNNPLEEELLNLVGFLDEYDLPRYGITLAEYFYPTEEVLNKVKKHLKEKDELTAQDFENGSLSETQLKDESELTAEDFDDSSLSGYQL